MQHAMRHDMYVHPLYCLRQSSSNPRGFSAGNDTGTLVYDLPDLLIPQLNQWSVVIYNTLAKDGMFPAGTDGDAIAKQRYGCGYKLLSKLVRQYIPQYTVMPVQLLDNKPNQQPQETIQQYFDRYDELAKL